MQFDTHCHVNFAAFKDDAHEVINRALENQTWLINVGTQIDTSRSALELAGRYEKGVYAAIGLHPVHTWRQILDEEESHFKTRTEIFDEALYAELLNKKVVAIGECGLDYFRLPQEDKDEAIKKQKEAFLGQISFAKKYNLPLIVHCRDAYDDVLEILNAEYTGRPGIIHSFTDTWTTAKKFLDFGFLVALNGILTFDKTDKLPEVARNTPIDRLLVETDAPYLTPPPNRGKRNEPSYVRFVVKKIAELKQIDAETAGQQFFDNASKLFGIKG